MELATGAIVDRYTVEGVLGEGGMAIVYLCRHNQLGTRHALKVLTMSSRAIKERLVQEGQVQATLRHPNIVAVTDIVVINGSPGLVMEYIEGPSLDDLLDQQNLTYEQADALVEGILAGVGHAHAKGLIHRDLKPANIMLSLEGNQLVPKVADFGLAKLLEGDDKKSRTRTGSTMGTPQYMSPEQVEDSKNVDHRTDVFACAAILYEMVTGHRAFSGESLYKIFGAVATGEYRNPRELRPDLPDRMVDAILGGLTPDKDDRIQTVDELLAVWRGEQVRAGAAPVEPQGPFSTDFVASVRSMTTEAAPSVPSDPTFAMAADAPLSVESLVQGPPPAPVADVPPVNPDRKKGAAASTIGAGAAVAVGGGVVVLGGIAVVALLGIGVVGALLMMGDEPTLPGEHAPSEPVAVVAPAPVAPGGQPVTPPTKPSASPAPRPAGGASSTVPSPSPVAVEPVPAPEPAVPAPEPDAPASSASAAALDDPDPKVRLAFIEANSGKPAYVGRYVQLAMSDPNRDVAVEAWRAAIKQYKLGLCAPSVVEPLVVDAIQSNRFSRVEALNAYAKRGSDLGVVTPHLTTGGPVVKNAAISAVVGIGKRGQRAAAQQALIDGRAKSRGPIKLRFDQAMSQL